MKKWLVVLISLLLAVCFAACSHADTPETTTDALTSVEESASQQADESAASDTTKPAPEPPTNENGDILLITPSSFYDEENPPSTELTDELKAQGVKEAYINDQGTVTYVVGKEDFEALKTYVDKEVSTALSGYKQTQPFVKNVACNSDFSVINLQVDSEEYSSGFGNFVVVWEAGLYGQMYQTFTGVAPEDISVDVVVTDVDSGEVIQRGHYPAPEESD